MKILFNILGILIYFLLRYTNRTDQTTKLSLSYWFKDNWPEFAGILLFDITLILLLVVGGIQVDISKILPSLPDGVTLIGDYAICFLIGSVISHGVYELFKTKVKK